MAHSKEREAEMSDIYWSRSILHIFCDASNVPGKTLVGLGCAFVYDGSIDVFSRQANAAGSPLGTIQFGEVEAVRFAVSQVGAYLKRPVVVEQPEEIVVYSDFSLIHQYVEGVGRIRIEYLGTEKKDNPWHRAAHNAARRAIFLKVTKWNG